MSDFYTNRLPSQRGLIMDVSMVEDEEAARRIRNLKIPDCLTNRPLVVGDDEQVKALKALEKRAEQVIVNVENDYSEDDDDDDDGESVDQ